jgi:enterochelin esterase-like enzyme
MKKFLGENIWIAFMIMLFLSGCSTFTPEYLRYEQVQPNDKRTPIDYAVYTPPNWQQGERLPVVLFLHGGGGSHESFERYQADEYLDAEMNAGRLPRFILVSPNGGNGFWMNWADGSYHYQDWVLNDVFPKVQADYHTLECPENCYLAGISMGGFGVLRFSYVAQDTFSAVSAVSSPIFSREQAEQQKPSWLIRMLFPFDRIFSKDKSQMAESDPYRVWSKALALKAPRLQLIVGDSDRGGIIASNKQLHQHLTDQNIEHDYYVYSGGHKWKYWVPNMNRMFNFLLNTE